MEKSAFLYAYLQATDSAKATDFETAHPINLDNNVLGDLTDQYPYFQIAHILKAVNSQKEGSLNASKTLARAATYSISRSYLKKLVDPDNKSNGLSVSYTSYPVKENYSQQEENNETENSYEIESISENGAKQIDSEAISDEIEADFNEIEPHEEEFGSGLSNYQQPRPSVQFAPAPPPSNLPEAPDTDEIIHEIEENMKEFKAVRERFQHDLDSVINYPEHEKTISNLEPTDDEISSEPLANTVIISPVQAIESVPGTSDLESEPLIETREPEGVKIEALTDGLVVIPETKAEEVAVVNDNPLNESKPDLKAEIEPITNPEPIVPVVSDKPVQEPDKLEQSIANQLQFLLDKIKSLEASISENKAQKPLVSGQTLTAELKESPEVKVESNPNLVPVKEELNAKPAEVVKEAIPEPEIPAFLLPKQKPVSSANIIIAPILTAEIIKPEIEIPAIMFSGKKPEANLEAEKLPEIEIPAIMLGKPVNRVDMAVPETPPIMLGKPVSNPAIIPDIVNPPISSVEQIKEIKATNKETEIVIPAAEFTKPVSKTVQNFPIPDEIRVEENNIATFDFEAFNESLSRPENYLSPLPEKAKKDAPKLIEKEEGFSQTELIDNFINLNPSISDPLDHSETTSTGDLSSSSTRLKTEIATENLAVILTRQGKIVKAIEIYQQLILQQPEKAAYFATQIINLTNLYLR